MKKTTRTGLFYSAIFVFLVASFLAVLYAQGYKFSFAEKKFLKTGSIVLSANGDADFYLQDAYTGSTSFLNNTLVIRKLLPGNYYVKAMKGDSNIWKKNVVVEEGLVTEFPHILLLSGSDESRIAIRKEIGVLFSPTPSPSPRPSPSRTPTPTPTKTTKPSASKTPTPIPFPEDSQAVLIKSKLYFNNNGTPELLASNVKGFSISPDKNKIVWWNTKYEVWVSWVNGTNYQPYKNSGDTRMIYRVSFNFDAVRWFRGEDHLVLRTPHKGAPANYEIFEIDTRGGMNTTPL